MPRGTGSGNSRSGFRSCASPSIGRTCSRSWGAGGRDRRRAGPGFSDRCRRGCTVKSPSQSARCGTNRHRSPVLQAMLRPEGWRISTPAPGYSPRSGGNPHFGGSNHAASRRVSAVAGPAPAQRSLAISARAFHADNRHTPLPPPGTR
jgi:hypothetical protein